MTPTTESHAVTLVLTDEEAKLLRDIVQRQMRSAESAAQNTWLPGTVSRRKALERAKVLREIADRL